MQIIILVWVSLLGCTGGAVPLPTSQRPNIVIFLVDDLGWQDVSVAFAGERTAFNDRYKTPNVSRLAESGLRFTNAYAASPVCTPTRVAIMSGIHPARSRVTNWTLQPDRSKQETAPASYPLGSPEWNHLGLDSADRTLASILNERGYATIHAGKAHFGALTTPGADLLNLGFQVNIAGHAAGAPGSFLGEMNYGNDERSSPWAVPGLEKYHGTKTFLTTAITNEVLREMDSIPAERPFFLHFAPYAVHIPLAGYEPSFTSFLEEGLDEEEAKYASMIVAFDDALGRILDKLDEMHVAENTLIVFTSDNGGLSYARRGITPSGTGANTHNAPLRSGKGSAYEGGTRVPMIVSWARPNNDNRTQQTFLITSGTSSDVPVVSQDIPATIFDVIDNHAGIRWNDGRSIKALLDGQHPSPDQALYWHYPHKWGPDGPGLDPFTSMRQGPWKLIWFYEAATWELYHLDDDLGESNNLAGLFPNQVAAMAANMLDWMQDTSAQTPVDRTTGRTIPLPGK